MVNIFLPNQKKKKIEIKCGLPTGFNNGHPLDRKQKFFLGWPETSYHSVRELVILSADVCGALEGFSHPTLESEWQRGIYLSTLKGLASGGKQF